MLRVHFSHGTVGPDGSATAGAAWFVEVYVESAWNGTGWYAISHQPDGMRAVEFGRKRDAEMAIQAMEAAGIDSWEDIIRRDRKEVVGIMVSALQW